MGETVTLRKKGAFQRFTLSGTVVTHTKGRGKVKGGVLRRSWLNGVMARANRDRAVAELIDQGWTVDRVAKAKQPPARKLATKDLVVAGEPQPITRAEISALGPSLPGGYAAFLQKLGAGELAGLRIFTPDEVVHATESWRTHAASSAPGLWVNFRESFREGEELAFVVLAQSIGGDSLVMGSDAKALWILPRGSDRVHRVGGSFAEALGWWCFSDMLGARERDDRGRVRFTPRRAA